MNTKTRVDLAKSLAPKLSLTEQEAERFIVDFLDEVRNIIGQGEQLKLRGFGTFYPVHKPKRLARDPNTGERFPKPAYTTMRLRPSSTWRKEKT